MSDRQDMIEQERNAQRHSQNLSRPADEGGNAPETLKYISEPEESVESPTKGLEWANSKSASTANLSDEDVRSKDWKLEYHRALSLMSYPPQYGLNGHWRAWAYDDREQYRERLSPDDRLQLEGFMEIGKEAATRSKGGWGVETSTRDTKESIVRNEEDSGKGGLLGRLRQ